MKFFLSTLLVVVFFSSSFSQSYKFKIYNEKDGLENRYINTINQDPNGRLIIGTGEGLFTFDGFKFKAFHTADSLADELIECSFSDSDGSIWLGHGNGNATVFHDSKCQKINLSKFLTSKVVDITKDNQNKIWIASQSSGFVCTDNTSAPIHIVKGLTDFTIFSLQIDKQNNFWIGTDLGLVLGKVLKNEEMEITYVENLPLSSVIDIIPTKEGYIVATEDAGLFDVNYNNGTFTISPLLFNNAELTGFQVKTIRQDQERNLLISTNQHGLILYSNRTGNTFQSRQTFDEAGTDASNNVKLSFHDREGNLWIGTIGGGLHKLEDGYFSNYNAELNSGVYSFLVDNDTLWSGYKGKINISTQHPGNIINTFDQSLGLPDDIISCIYKDDGGAYWAGTDSKGCYVLSKNKKKFQKVSLTAEFENCKITSISGHGEMAYIATNYGVFFVKNNRVISHATIETGLSGNVVKSLFKDSKNRIWLGTTSQEIPFIENGELKYFTTKFENFQLTLKCFTEDKQGNIWVGTDGNGVICLTCEDNKYFTKENGLNSDYCYSLIYSNDELWVGHRAGLSKINLKNNTITVYQPEASLTQTFNENAITKCYGEFVLFGTSAGIIRYDKAKDVRNTFEPILYISSILISDKETSLLPIIKLPYGDYKLDIVFQGISLKNPEGVKYQFILEGYDNEWSELTIENIARYNHLPSGEYEFKVKTYNSDGIGGTTIKSFKIIIAPPFWLQWWFFAIVVLALIFSFQFIVKRRERLLKENQEKLKMALDERTKEVVEQKELIEAKNKDITDSILYAKNIQNAMLPPRGSLSNYFHDAFVYYKPRDIVSGDFFWVSQFGTKTIVACADCTGHGVPGAFMSLIGVTILKDAAKSKDVQSPSELLTKLDHELNVILNKKLSEDSVKDGMDIGIIDFDTETKLLRFGSANRPIFIKRKSDFIELRGDRRSIGDPFKAESTGYNLQEVQLEKGDVVYMFSDGITDQFGGPFIKKIKRKGVLDFLKSISHLSMGEQSEEVRRFIREWKGENEQLDDMLLIAFQI